MEMHLQKLSEKYSSLMGGRLISFKEVAAMKNAMGVYIAYSPKGEIIYIGSTNQPTHL